MTSKDKSDNTKRVSPQYRTYYFYPPFEGDPIAVIIPFDQVEFHDGHFTKLYRRYESKNWRIEEIKSKEKVYETPQIHPQTGRPIG